MVTKICSQKDHHITKQVTSPLWSYKTYELFLFLLRCISGVWPRKIEGTVRATYILNILNKTQNIYQNTNNNQ